jgi:hypothetical protein
MSGSKCFTGHATNLVPVDRDRIFYSVGEASTSRITYQQELKDLPVEILHKNDIIYAKVMDTGNSTREVGRCKETPLMVTDQLKVTELLNGKYTSQYNRYNRYYTCEFKFLDGKLHAEDGPAVIFYYSDDIGFIFREEIWYRNGRCHRDYKPAKITVCDSELDQPPPDNIVYKEWRNNGIFIRCEGDTYYQHR